MCGIVVGLTLGKKTKKEEATRQRVLRVLTTELLVETETRGKDAVGAAVLFNDGNFYGMKRGEKVSSFIHKFGNSSEYYGGLIKVWKEHETPARVYLGHCRAATYGNTYKNVNNHPIKIGNLVGIHNGTLRNHEEIFKRLKCKRDGEVDSEAIFRLLDHFTKKGTEPFTLDMIQEVVTRLQGQFAVVLFNADNLKQVPVFRDARPVEFVLIRSLGILLMMSERKFWTAVWPRYERLANYYQDKELLPSLVKKDNVLLETMPDDTAVIFNLDANVDENTTIDDISESKKMARYPKLWVDTQTTTKSGYSYGTRHQGGSAGYQSSYASRNTAAQNKTETDKKENAKEEPKKEENKAVPRRVFDNITKKYVVKAGDKVLTASNGVIIDVDSNENLGYDMDSEEEVASPPVTIEDKTSYAVAEADTVDDAKETNNGKDDAKDTDNNNVETVEVDINTIPVEVRETAELAYQELPLNKKGFLSDEELMDRIDITSEALLDSLGPTIIANRVYKVAWKEGFMAATMEDLDYKWIEKSTKRSQYIYELKKLVINLIANQGKNDKHEDIDKTINKLRSVFNSEELEKIKSIVEVEK